MRGEKGFLCVKHFSGLKRVRYNKKRANSMFAPCKLFFSTGKSRLRVIPFIYFISCLFIVYYSIPEVSSIGIQVYWAGIPEVSSARNFRQTGIPEVSSGVKKSRLNKFLFIHIKRRIYFMSSGPPNIIIVYIKNILFFIISQKTSFY